jgi:phenylalanyl-tRNA synthetase beta chain
MAKIRFEIKEIEKYIKLDSSIIEKMNMFGTPVEKSEEELEIEVFPNRPDLLSLPGFMRSFLMFLGKPNKTEYKIKKSDCKIIVNEAVKKIRPYSMAAIVKSVAFTDEKIKEIMQWQEKIHATYGRNRKKMAMGFYLLDKIKFPVTYTAKSPKDIVFEPLDMPEKMNALKILQRHPTGREYAYQLEGFDKYPVYYDSNNEVLSMPPIINSNNSGKILPNTKDVFIECSGSDLETLKKVITLAVVDLIDAGGKAYSVDVVYGNKKEAITLETEQIKISLEDVNKLLGLQLKESDLTRLLPKMGYEYSKGKVKIPCWRTDILHPVDITEDIAIAYGYDKFIPQIPSVASIGSEDKQSKIKSRIAEILIGLGLLETSSYHLIKQEEVALSEIKEKLEVSDSKTEYKILRPNLLIPSLRILSENKDNEYPQRFFELGTVFSPDKQNKSESGVLEQQNLIIALCPSNFTEAKQILDYLFKMLSLDHEIKDIAKTELIEGRTGSINLKGKQIGYLGELHPETLRNCGIKYPVSVIEISLEEIFNLIKN